MDFKTVENKIDEIIEKYWHEDDAYYSSRRETEDEYFSMSDELKEFCESNGIDYEIQEVEGFDSPGYGINFLAIAFKINNGNNFGSKMGLKTVALESM